jgi:hypothetical protein
MHKSSDVCFFLVLNTVFTTANLKCHRTGYIWTFPRQLVIMIGAKWRDMRILVIFVKSKAQIETCSLFSCFFLLIAVFQLHMSNLTEPDIFGPSQDGWWLWLVQNEGTCAFLSFCLNFMQKWSVVLFFFLFFGLIAVFQLEMSNATEPDIFGPSQGGWWLWLVQNEGTCDFLSFSIKLMHR